jgi:polysaccharide pyruvyl transferase WcaK-like protein
MFKLNYLIQQICYVFNFKKTYKKKIIKQIAVIGGFGFGNTGDEAQLNATVDLLTKRYPDFQIVVMSPKPNYTYEQHQCFVQNASRVALFNQGYPHDCYSGKFSSKQKITFLLNASLALLNAYLIRADLPTIFINARKSQYLQTIFESKLLYISGGGFLTGPTLSRLWDGAVLCKIASIFKTPVVMSGQTIGIWENNFNKMLAKWGFSNVEIITVRDEEYSLKDLKQIGLSGEKYFATHDDALFCKKTEERVVNEEDYVTINFHYWGMDDNTKKINIDKMHNIIEEILNKTSKKLVFIPMHISDKLSYDDYIKMYPNDRFIYFDYDYDFKKIRNVIANSKLCVTMKHHPIIFAMGENVPVISLAYSQYYIHKNMGALMQYEQEQYSINLAEDDYFVKFQNLFDDILQNRARIVNKIVERKQKLKERKDVFLQKVDELIFS